MTDTAPQVAKDNLFGICNAAGEDLGFNPLWLRLVFASTFIFDPAVVIASYFALGAFILVARLVFPRAAKARESAEIVTLAPARIEEPVDLARAA
jgi:phage shock protein PspC (stress-responsive transcriptional regulator)